MVTGTCVAVAHLGLYTSDIGWGQWVNIVHETVCRQWFGVANAVSCVAISDYRIYWWRPPVVTRDSRGVGCAFLKKTDGFCIYSIERRSLACPSEKSVLAKKIHPIRVESGWEAHGVRKSPA